MQIWNRRELAVKEAHERANQQRVAVQEAKTSIKSSEMRANQQQAVLRGQTSQRSKAMQLSPLSGVVADIPTRVGEFAVAGLSTTSLMTIADMSTINVEVNVDETEINNVDVDQNGEDQSRRARRQRVQRQSSCKRTRWR